MLKAPKEEVEEHLRKVHSDPRRKEELDLEGKLCGSEEPTIPYDDESSDGRKSTTSSERLGEDLHRGRMEFHTEFTRTARD